MGLAEERRIAHSLEKIADCAKLVTQILNDNRETINLIFKDVKDMLKANENQMELYEKLRKGK